jgi:hypothetical protein
MGYTHYWGFKVSPKKIIRGGVLFASAVDACKLCIEKIPEYIWDIDGVWKKSTKVDGKCLIAGPNGYGPAHYDNKYIALNGRVPYDCEPFYISYNDDNSFGFCKTARLRYDVAVCISLICFKYYFGENFEYSSDGDINKGECGWELAKEITDDYFYKLRERSLYGV